MKSTARHIHTTLKNTSMTISNLIGPTEKMGIANHPCKGLYFMVVGVPQVDINPFIFFMISTMNINVMAFKSYKQKNKISTCPYYLICIV